MTNTYLLPAKIGSVELRNRIIMGSMHTGLEEEKELSSLAEFYRERARGGVGLIITGGISPNKAGVVFAGGAQMCVPEHAKKHEVVTKAVHDEGGKIFMQILHAGRYAITPDCVAPSAIKAPINPISPKELSHDEIEATIDDFAKAAAFAKDAGYDGVEIMGSEGYLINEFLVSHTNQRNDEWGGDYSNRMRFAVEVARHTRAKTGKEFGIIFRISLLDLIPNGSNQEEIQSLAKALELAGVDALDSGFGWHEARVPTIAASVPPTPFLDYTQTLKSWVSIPVIAANRFFKPSQIENAVDEQKADFVSMARPFLADANFVRKAMQPDEIIPCIACNQACLDRIFDMKKASCLVNPRAAREASMPLKPAKRPKNIAVVGAGPAGLSASIVLSERGHHVTLFEAESEIGGQLKLAAKIPGKEDFKRLLSYFENIISRNQVNLRAEKASIEMLKSFEEVVIATGVKPRIPDVVGIEYAVPYDELISGDRYYKRVTIMGSGPIGFDVASLLVERENDSIAEWRDDWGVVGTLQARGGLGQAKQRRPERQVTMLQRSTTPFGKTLGKTTGWIHRTRLDRAGVNMIGGVNYRAVSTFGVSYEKDYETTNLDSDIVVICAGQESVNALYDECVSAGIKAHVIGGANNAHKIDAERAIFEAYDLALKI